MIFDDFLNIYLLIYLFGCVWSSLQHVGSLVAARGLLSCQQLGSLVVACELLVAARMWDLVP